MENKEHTLITVESVNRQLIEMWDAISLLDGDDRVEAERQGNETATNLWKQFHDQEALRDAAPALLKENQELKARIEELENEIKVLQQFDER